MLLFHILTHVICVVIIKTIYKIKYEKIYFQFQHSFYPIFQKYQSFRRRKNYFVFDSCSFCEICPTIYIRRLHVIVDILLPSYDFKIQLYSDLRGKKVLAERNWTNFSIWNQVPQKVVVILWRVGFLIICDKGVEKIIHNSAHDLF